MNTFSLKRCLYILQIATHEVSLRSFNRLGSGLSVMDFIHLGSALALRSVLRTGSCLSTFSLSRFGSSVSEDRAKIGDRKKASR